MKNTTRNITSALALIALTLGASTLQAGSRPIPGVYVVPASFASATTQADHEEEIDIHDIMWNTSASAGGEHEVEYDIARFSSQARGESRDDSQSREEVSFYYNRISF